MTRRALRVGILGAGAIAAGFDSPGDSRILTLAHAVTASPDMELKGFFDVRPERAKAAEQKWRCPPSPRDRKVWLNDGWEVICIATPDESHASDFRDVLRKRPRAILMEKPFSLDGREALRLMEMARLAGVPVLVDFPRREHSAVRRVTKLLRSGRLGPVRRISGMFSGGLQHNGVHLLDLVAGWMPPIRRVRRIGGRDGLAQLQLLSSEGSTILVLSAAVQPETYVWELRVETTRARIELSGVPEALRLFRRGDHPNYPRFTGLVESQAWSMEDEPLLLAAIRRLSRLIASPVAARTQWQIEAGRQRFFNSVFAQVRE